MNQAYILRISDWHQFVWVVGVSKRGRDMQRRRYVIDYIGRVVCMQRERRRTGTSM